MRFKQAALRAVTIASLSLLGSGALPAFVSSASAQDAPAAFTNVVRYDIVGRSVGTIAPDPDNGGRLKYAATRTTYDARGLAIKVETGELAAWQSEGIAPKDWSGFTILSSVETQYDIMGRAVKTLAIGSDGVITSITQNNFDNLGRPLCTAVRMNSALFTGPNAYDGVDACSLGSAGADGPDRITKIVYDAASQVLQMRRAVGTPLEQAEVSYDYTLNGQKKHVIDANGNKAEYIYDGHDRLVQWRFPNKGRVNGFNDSNVASVLSSAGSASNNDYEQYSYDNNGNRTMLRKRDGSIITYQYDALNRNTVKLIPNRSGVNPIHTRNVYYQYDLRGLQTAARFNSFSGEGVFNNYDGFGRMTSSRITERGFDKTIHHEYDDNSNRTKVRYAQETNGTTGTFVSTYDGLNRLHKVYHRDTRFLLKTYTYNQRGLMKGTQERYKTKSDYNYDAIGRTVGIDHSFRAGQGVTYTFGYNPASQIINRTTSNDAYAWSGHVDVDRSYSTNGLNQYTQAGGANFTYDKNGNLTSDGTNKYIYDVENRLVQVRDQTTNRSKGNLRYDPLGRLAHSNDGSSAGAIFYLYDGDALVAEYKHPSSTSVLRLYGHGQGVDDPIWWYEADTHYRFRFLHKNHQGSVVSVTSWASANPTLAINSYDAYGIPAETNTGRFQYTGQIWLSDIGMYYYKARIYSPTLGRFLQTDPIGYEDQYNLYAYVGNDPVNKIDPTGESGVPGIGRGTASSQNCSGNCGEILIERIDILTSIPANPANAVKGIVVIATKASIKKAKKPGFFKRIKQAIFGKKNKGALPKPGTGKGSVPKSERDPKRLFTPKERAQKRAEQDDKCANGCGTNIDQNNSEGHHTKRHADGGRTNSENHAEVCKDCHKDLHSPK